MQGSFTPACRLSSQLRWRSTPQEKGVQLIENRGVVAVEAGKLILDDGRVEAFDEALWCTQAAAPAWLAGTGLPLGEQG